MSAPAASAMSFSDVPDTPCSLEHRARPRRGCGCAWPGLLLWCGEPWRRGCVNVNLLHAVDVCILTCRRPSGRVFSIAQYRRELILSIPMRSAARRPPRNPEGFSHVCVAKRHAAGLGRARPSSRGASCRCCSPLARGLRAAEGRRGRPRPAAGGGTAAARGRRRHGRAAGGRPGHRAAGPPRGLARRAGARARHRHRAEAPVPRRQRREGRPAAVPDRPGALPGARSTARRPRWRARRPTSTQATAQAERYKPLVEAQRDQQAGLHQRAWPRRSRPRPTSPPPRPRVQTAQINLGYAIGHRADLRPHRPRAGHRRRAGRRRARRRSWR